MIKNCLECGKEFVGRTNGEFCSKHCSKLSMWKNPQIRDKIRKSFNHTVIKKIENNFKVIKCSECGKEIIFDNQHPKMKYCSQKCSGIAFWKNNGFKVANLISIALKKSDKHKKHLKELSESRKGKSLSIEVRKKISAGHQRIPIEKWKKFSSHEPYGEEFNKQLKNQIRNRDNQVCMNCNIHREKIRRALNIHHINYDKTCNLPQNLISLCDNCHALTIGNKEYWQKLFQEKFSKLYDYQYSETGEIILKIENENK